MYVYEDHGVIAMSTYIILSKFSPDLFKKPQAFKAASTAVSAKIKAECPGVRWKTSYATDGRYDVVDVVESDDPLQIERAAGIIHSEAQAVMETMPATLWSEFLAKL